LYPINERMYQELVAEMGWCLLGEIGCQSGMLHAAQNVEGCMVTKARSVRCDEQRGPLGKEKPG
jgi:hypothetical protein